MSGEVDPSIYGQFALLSEWILRINERFPRIITEVLLIWSKTVKRLMTLQAINTDKVMVLESKLQYFPREDKLKQIHFKEDRKVL